MEEKSQIYRNMIDGLVEMCHNGQGQIGPNRIRNGIWNENATEESIPDQYEINQFLLKLSDKDREVLARMLEKEVVTGVFETLKKLEEFQIKPFESGYEGSSYNDFIGRLDNWEWPEK